MPSRSRQQAPDEPLRAAVAVDVGGVEERHAGVGRGVQRRHRGVLVDLAPVGADLPRAEADLGDVAAGLAKGSQVASAVEDARARQRRRRTWAALLGRRSRVKTPFLLPSARKTPGATAKSAKFQTCSPTTASTRSKTRWVISSSSDWYSSVHGAEGRPCMPATASAPYSVTMIGLPCFAAQRVELGLQPALGGGQVARVLVPAVVAVEHHDVEEVGHDVALGRRQHHVGEADGPGRVEPPRLGGQRLEVGARLRRVGLGLVGDAPQHDAGVVLVARDELADRLAVHGLRGVVDGLGGEGRRVRGAEDPQMPMLRPTAAVSSITTMPWRSA